MACMIYFPDQGLNTNLQHWEHRVLATGPPGKSRGLVILKVSFSQRFSNSLGHSQEHSQASYHRNKSWPCLPNLASLQNLLGLKLELHFL